jgi:hypothetical protein
MKTRNKVFQAKMISDEAMLRTVALLAEIHGGYVSRWDVCAYFDWIPWKVVNAKLIKCERKKLLDGCGECTCGTGWTLTHTGRALLLS